MEPPGTAPGSEPLITCAFITIVPEGTGHIEALCVLDGRGLGASGIRGAIGHRPAGA